MDKENKNLYEGIDEKLVKFAKAIEFYGDYGNHELCTENCSSCNFHPLCEYRGSENVNLALYLMDEGYGNVKQAVKEFAEKFEEMICKYSTYDGWSILKILRDCKKELYGDGWEVIGNIHEIDKKEEDK